MTKSKFCERNPHFSTASEKPSRVLSRVLSTLHHQYQITGYSHDRPTSLFSDKLSTNNSSTFYEGVAFIFSTISVSVSTSIHMWLLWVLAKLIMVILEDLVGLSLFAVFVFVSIKAYLFLTNQKDKAAILPEKQPPRLPWLKVQWSEQVVNCFKLTLND